MQTRTKRIAIIGSGPSGIAAGRELLQQGFGNFTIFEKEKAAGGTWHMQTYPGLACDVWAHSYTYSYAPNPDWSQAFVPQKEIEAYLQKCSQEFGLEKHTRFNSRVEKITLLDDLHWQLQITDGNGNTTTEIFDAVINAMGNQHTASYPNIPGRENFHGESWHSTHWNHQLNLKNKKVLVIGSAAAAVQIVPAIAPEVAELTVLQRSANWIVPRNNKHYSEVSKKLFRTFKPALLALRAIQGIMMNYVHGAVLNDSKRMAMFENMGRKFIDKTIADPELRKAVTPDSRYGCKRPLVSDDYYPALNRDNVTLIHEAAEEINETGCKTSAGKQIDVDIIIYCTGYKVMDFDRIEVTGLNNNLLAEQMIKAPEAFRGLLVPGFPNYFMAAGPNALVLSVSYFKSIEANVKNIVDLLVAMENKGIKSIDAKADLTEDYNQWVREKCKAFSWGSGDCHNYYINDSGHSPFLYPETYKHFLQMRKSCTLDKFTAYH